MRAPSGRSRASRRRQMMQRPALRARSRAARRISAGVLRMGQPEQRAERRDRVRPFRGVSGVVGGVGSVVGVGGVGGATGGIKGVGGSSGACGGACGACGIGGVGLGGGMCGVGGGGCNSGRGAIDDRSAGAQRARRRRTVPLAASFQNGAARMFHGEHLFGRNLSKNRRKSAGICTP